jgi:hypothetical protein
MKKIHQLLLFIYYLMWVICLIFAYAYLTDKFYSVGRWFGPIAGLLTIILSSITLFTLSFLYIFRKTKRALNAKFIQLSLIPFLGLIPFFILKSIPNELENQVVKIKVTYIAYGCECANWKIKTINGEPCIEPNCEDIFLEPLKSKKEIQEAAFQNGNTIELTGKFYKRKGFPKDYFHSEQLPEKARIFQYSSYKIMN